MPFDDFSDLSGPETFREKESTEPRPGLSRSSEPGHQDRPGRGSPVSGHRADRTRVWRAETWSEKNKNKMEQGSTPRPPDLNENPSLRIRQNRTFCWRVLLALLGVLGYVADIRCHRRNRACTLLVFGSHRHLPHLGTAEVLTQMSPRASTHIAGSDGCAEPNPGCEPPRAASSLLLALAEKCRES